LIENTCLPIRMIPFDARTMITSQFIDARLMSCAVIEFFSITLVNVCNCKIIIKQKKVQFLSIVKKVLMQSKALK